MVPIESITGAIQFLISVLVAYKLYKSSKKNPSNINIKYFFYTFVLLSVIFLFNAVSILSIVNFRIDFIISAVNIIGRGIILLSIMFFTYIPLNILKDNFWKGIIPFLILIVAVFSNMFSLMSLFSQPRTPVKEIGNFVIRIHRNDIYTKVGLVAIGSIAVFTLLLGIYKYLRIISKSNDEFVFNRGVMLIFAALFFILGISSNYFLALVLPVWGRLGGEIFYLLALVVFLASALYKKVPITQT